MADELQKEPIRGAEDIDRLSLERFSLPSVIAAGSFSGQTSNGVYPLNSGRGVRHAERFGTGQYRIYLSKPHNHSQYLVFMQSNDINVIVTAKTKDFFSVADAAVIGSGLNATTTTTVSAESDVRYDFLVFNVSELSPISAYDFSTSTSTTTTTTTSTTTSTSTSIS